MPLSYPPYPADEYNCLVPGTAGLREIHAMMNAEKELETIREELNEQVYSKPNFTQVKYRIEEEISSISAKRSRDAQETLKSLCLDLQRDIHGQMRRKPMADNRVRRAILEIMDMYGSFDTEQFNKDFEAITPEDDESQSAEVKIKQLKRKEKDIITHIRKVWTHKKMLTHLRIVPQVWKDRRLSSQFSEGDMAIHILKHAMTHWRYRSLEFNIPITPNCTAILTLPNELADDWMQFHEEVEIKVGRQKYMHYNAEAQGKSLEKTKDSLPGLFA